MCAIDRFSKYAWLVLLKDRRGISIVNTFQEIISKRCKPNKIWVDQGDEFYNNISERFLKIHNIEMHSIYNEVKSVVAERFIRTFKTRFLSTLKLFQKMFILILMLNTMKILMKKILILKLVIMS